MKIIAVGDSTTAGTPGFLSPLESPPNGSGNIESQYAYWMMKNLPDREVLNRGINGERSDQILRRFDRDTVGNPDFIVVLAGVNDIYQGFPGESTRSNLLEMYTRAKRLGATPIACSVLPYNTMGRQQAATMRDLNDWIKSKSMELALPFADTSSAGSDPSRPGRLAGSPDGLHPDVAGYKKMASTISDTIDSSIAARGQGR